MPSCASFLSPLEVLAMGAESRSTVNWTDNAVGAYTAAQAHLSKATSICIPRREDELWLCTDAAVAHRGIDATLFVCRGD